MIILGFAPGARKRSRFFRARSKCRRGREVGEPANLAKNPKTGERNTLDEDVDYHYKRDSNEQFPRQVVSSHSSVGKKDGRSRVLRTRD